MRPSNIKECITEQVDSRRAMAMMNAKPREKREDMRSLLKALRLRLDPHTFVLGGYERLSRRRGRRVSQEEIAEAVGVSRVWYSLLESGAPVQPSVALLDRLANALNATPRERAMLFVTGIREIGCALTTTME